MLLGAFLLFCGLCIIPLGATVLPVAPSFLPAFGSAVFIVDMVTAALLLSQAKASKDRRAANLGLAYAFSAMTIVPHLLAFPGALTADALIGKSASAIWLWCVWHGGFAIGVLRYAMGSAAPGSVTILPSLATLGAVILSLTLLATAGLPWLPTILNGSSFMRLNTIGVGPLVFVLNAAALAAVVTRLRGRTALDRWLAVGMLAATLDVAITLFSGGRFTLGWYVARCLSLATGMIVLVALLAELTRFFGRTAEANRRLQRLSHTDPLTLLPNRRAFDAALDTALDPAIGSSLGDNPSGPALGMALDLQARARTSATLLMIDIDWFKGFNDKYGHPAGDTCLQVVSGALARCCRRAGDMAARLGGEEFVVMLPAIDAAGAERVARSIHDAVADAAIPHAGSPFGRVTVSIGIATAAPDIHPRAMLSIADQAMYRAKQQGRNGTCIA